MEARASPKPFPLHLYSKPHLSTQNSGLGTRPGSSTIQSHIKSRTPNLSSLVRPVTLGIQESPSLEHDRSGSQLLPPSRCRNPDAQPLPPSRLRSLGSSVPPPSGPRNPDSLILPQDRISPSNSPASRSRKPRSLSFCSRPRPQLPPISVFLEACLTRERPSAVEL